MFYFIYDIVFWDIVFACERTDMTERNKFCIADLKQRPLRHQKFFEAEDDNTFKKDILI